MSVRSSARSSPWSWAVTQWRAASAAAVGDGQDRASGPARGPSSGRRRAVMSMQLGMADDLVEGPEPQRGQQLPDLLGDVLEEVDDELGPAA